MPRSHTIPAPTFQRRHWLVPLVLLGTCSALGAIAERLKPTDPPNHYALVIGPDGVFTIAPDNPSSEWFNPRYDLRLPAANDEQYLIGRHVYQTRDLMGRKI